jgi:hypothetical protein
MRVFNLVTLIFFSVCLQKTNVAVQAKLTGAWTTKKGDTTHLLLFRDDYFSYSVFNVPGKEFIQTFGGTFSETGDQLYVNIEFNTKSEKDIGGHKLLNVKVSGRSMALNLGNGLYDWQKSDDGTGPLAGNWRITGRMVNGQMQEIPKRARKTLKLLSGTRFQWIAINPETKEFFGTGGGSYTFKDGKYVENIEFFSRDSSRVGASLVFEGSVNNNIWTHKGLSSKGDPIHEEWTREKE